MELTVSLGASRRQNDHWSLRLSGQSITETSFVYVSVLRVFDQSSVEFCFMWGPVPKNVFWFVFSAAMFQTKYTAELGILCILERTVYKTSS